ncbi:DUF4349 domain-containing protein [Egicoccus sp. AB-alg6-2]|uniref:DUF4349 domain-containing protein n=1 Tax=Egicoccus sp. AB-alg6-2 TaxID=3242692 RepID=UPI00359E6FD8
MGTTRRTGRRRVGAGLMLAVFVIGCSGGQAGDTADSATMEAAEDAPEPAPAMDSGGGFDSGAGFDHDIETGEEPAHDGEVGSGDTALPTAVTLGRRVIRTATIELEDRDPAEVHDGVVRAVDQAGGFVATADLRRDRDGVLSGTVTVRVPSERLEPTLDDLEALADNTPVRRVEEQDVTVLSADLRAQLRNLEAFEEELRALLAEIGESSAEADELLRVYERIREVRAEIDRIEGRLDMVGDQVSLATITVRLTPSVAAAPVADPGWAPGETVRAALSAASRSLTAVADAAIWIGLAVLPVVAVIGLPALAVWAAWRRRQRIAETS